MQRASSRHASDYERVDLLELTSDPRVRLVPVHLPFIAPRVALRNKNLCVLQAELALPTSDVATYR